VAQAWYDEATRRALSTLADGFELERFDAELNTWGPAGRESTPGPWRMTLEDEVQAGEGFGDRLAACVTPGVGAWWSEGSGAVPASLLIGTALPDGQRFAGLMDVANVGWESVVKLRP
jgi:type VI secretion system protein ImpM